MRNDVSVSAIAECPFSIAEDYAVDYLRSAEGTGLVTTAGGLRHRVTIGFGLHLDILEEGRSHDEVRFQWTSGSRFLPDFRGTLRFRIDGTRTQIQIDGSYDPPFGFFGRFFDRVAGRRIAQVSLQDLASRIARYLGERQSSWLAAGLHHSMT